MDNGHDLVLATIAGDLGAYSELVESIHRMVIMQYSSVLKYFPAHVNDGVQDFLLGLPDLLESKFDYSCKVSTFIYSASRLCALNYLKGLKTMKRGYGNISLESDMDIEGSFESPLNREDREMSISLWRRMDNCVSEMSPKLSDVFNLYVEGYSHKEIAECLGIRENTSSKRLFEVKKILRQKFKQDFNKLFRDL